MYEYNMVQMSSSVENSRRGQPGSAAAYLQHIVEKYAVDGFEFYRVDSLGVLDPPGCIAGVFGGKHEYHSVHVATFRRRDP